MQIFTNLHPAAQSTHSLDSCLVSQERERIQQEFCKGKFQVVVATVAFGMGLDAAHVTGIVHLTIPRSLEEYIQQALH